MKFDKMTQISALKDEISKVLSCALQPDSDVQRLAEERKKALEMTDEYPEILIDIISSNEEATPERQMAATFLKNFLEESYFKNKGTVHHPDTKKIMSHLLKLLVHNKSVIQQMISSCLVTLVVQEYPYFWDVVAPKVRLSLKSGNVNEINGALQFMKDLLCDNSSCDRIYFNTDFMPPLLEILQIDQFPIEVRCSAIQCIIFIAESAVNYPEFDQLISEISHVFKELLSQPYGSTNNFRLKGELILKISYIVYRIGGQKANFLVTTCLPAIGDIMFKCCVEYKKVMLENSVIPRDKEEQDEPMFFKTLFLNILYLLDVLLDSTLFNTQIAAGLDDLLYYLLIIMCLPKECDEFAFVEDDTLAERNCDFLIRQTSINTFCNIMDICSWSDFSFSLGSNFAKLLNEANLERHNSEEYYARINEVLMFVMGILRKNFAKNSQSNRFFPEPHLEMWTTLLNNSNLHWLILGRIIWLGSKYTLTLPSEALSTHMTCVERHLNSSIKNVRIACVEAMKNHLQKASQNPNRMVLFTHISNIARGLLNACDILNCVPVDYLRTLAFLFECYPDGVLPSSEKISQIVITAITSYLWIDPILKEINFLLGKLCVITTCRDSVIRPIWNVIQKLIYRNATGKVEAAERGLELMNTLIKYTPEPMQDDIIFQGFHAAYNCIMENDDSNACQVATSCISNILIKSSGRVQSLTDPKGKLLAHCIPELIYKLLEPTSSKLTGKLGRLCVVSIMILPDVINPHMESLVKAVLSSLQRCEDEYATQNLCFIFAYIFMSETGNIIKFLSGIPGPDGNSALAYFFNNWKIKHILSSPKFEKKLSAIAICKMIEFSITENDLKINDVEILVDISFGSKIKYSGLEYLYFLLVNILDSEAVVKSNNESDADETEFDDEDVLIKEHPLFNLDLLLHIITFIRTYNNVHYNNVISNIKDRDLINKLEKLGILPER